VKHFKIISLLSIIFAFSAAQAETKVNGEFWGNFQYNLDNGQISGATADDQTNPMGFDVARARVLVNHSFNDMWSATLGLKGDTLAAVALNRAFITGKDWLAEGHTMHFGLQKNAYERNWDSSHQSWIHRSLTKEFSSNVLSAINTMDSGGTAAAASAGDYAGLNYNIMFNDMWSLELSINNGGLTEVDNDGAAAAQANSDAFGYGLTVNGKLNDNMSLTFAYDNADDYVANAKDGADTNTAGYTITRLGFDYTSDMIDAGLEYAMWAANHSDGNTGAEMEDLAGLAIHVDYKYAEGSGVYFYYAMLDGFDDIDDSSTTTAEDFGIEASYKLGHYWAIDSNVNTGIFYEATTRDAAGATTNDKDESNIMWRWAANF